MDLTKKTGIMMLRIDVGEEDGRTAYALEMPRHLQGCEIMTVWSCASLAPSPLRRLCESYLWRFAAVQDPDTGRFPGIERFLSPYFMLRMFAEYDHPASRAAILRALPWIVSAQNKDGTWAEDDSDDAPTQAALSALLRIREDLPDGMRLAA